ncbi:glutathione peroxidase [Jannaschia sp. KMU-145]|uniref:glutathione peroxidase n=1 Tax=Jannaschia halovivens TaxID=3388667 RepID=UPI00396AF2D5
MRVILALLLLAALPARAFEFEALEGGTIDLSALSGGPVLVVNTASLCGFTDQYAELQALHERYGEQGLTVLAVPSDAFRQELADADSVAEFCEVNYGLTLPMTAITDVTGADAHPFYRWLADAHGAAPRWNFYKALLAPGGDLLAFETSSTKPLSPRMIDLVESALP